jgi:CMP-N-acetylneuraminic acid synthetase
MSVYAFVFARGGSKGLPGKNIKPLGGTPLIGHSIRLARQIGAVKKVCVSTDSAEIAAVASEYGAEVIERPAELATDNAPEWLAWQHAVGHVRSRGEDFDVFLSLPTTSPLRNVDDVEQCLAALDDRTDAVVTVTPSARSPYFNMVTRGPNGEAEVLIKASDIRRRQDAPAVYDMTTVAYVLRPDFILSHQGLFGGRVTSVIVPKERAVDVDDAFDFAVAEALYKARPR